MSAICARHFDSRAEFLAVAMEAEGEPSGVLTWKDNGNAKIAKIESCGDSMKLDVSTPCENHQVSTAYHPANKRHGSFEGASRPSIATIY